MLQIECMNRSLKVVSIPALVEQAGKNTLENCLMTILLALAMVSSEETVRENSLHSTHSTKCYLSKSMNGLQTITTVVTLFQFGFLTSQCT